MFNKMEKDGNAYYITSKVQFSPGLVFSNDDICKCFDFAHAMSFGSGGEHRSHRSGGVHKRKNGELFINTFQGKLTEYGFYRFLKNNKIEIHPPDISTYELGQWDSSDFCINDIKINIKSTKFFGNLLLLETADWNNNAHYLPNLNNNTDFEYDYFVLIRLKPSGERVMSKSRCLYSNNINKSDLRKLIFNQNWEFDIPGFITHDEVKYIIRNKQILPQRSKLNGTVVMDAGNFYIQAGDLTHINNIIPQLK
jgi:hypothetical protein